MPAGKSGLTHVCHRGSHHQPLSVESSGASKALVGGVLAGEEAQRIESGKLWQRGGLLEGFSVCHIRLWVFFGISFLITCVLYHHKQWLRTTQTYCLRVLQSAL